MKMMDIKGIKKAFITLHCGLGNFHDIEVEDLTKHKMDSEEMHINADACRIANGAKQAGHRLCAVGASVVKATETAVGTDGMLKEYDGWTNEFIFLHTTLALLTLCWLISITHIQPYWWKQQPSEVMILWWKHMTKR